MGIGLGPVGAAVIIGIGRVGRLELGVTMTDNGAEENRKEDNADSTNTTRAARA